MPTPTDNEIIRRLQEDDSSALALIWDAYAADLLGYLNGVLCSRHEAEDVLQDMFVTIAKKRQAVSQAENLKAYLFRMARNTAVNRIKSSQRRAVRDQTASEWLFSHGESDAAKASSDRIREGLEALPANQRSVIVMKFFRLKSFREIGELLGISENTAGSRYRYGMDKLRSFVREAGQ